MKKEKKAESIKPQQDATSVCIIINEQKYFFNHEPKDKDEVYKYTLMMKESISLMTNSSYPDIIESRLKDCRHYLKKLSKITTIDVDQIKNIENSIKSMSGINKK